MLSEVDRGHVCGFLVVSIIIYIVEVLGKDIFLVKSSIRFEVFQSASH